MKRILKQSRLLAACLLLTLLASCAFSAPEKEEGGPAPPPPLVEDRAGVLGDATVGRIEREGALLRDLTGAEITVFTVDFLGGQAIADYARGLFDERKPGDPAQNNGLLLLLCIGEEDYYLLTGEGLSQALPPEALRQILDECLEEDFERGDYDAGAAAVFDRLVLRLEQLYGVSIAQGPAPQEEQAEWAFSPWLLAALFFLLLACLFLLLSAKAGRRRRRRVV